MFVNVLWLTFIFIVILSRGKSFKRATRGFSFLDRLEEQEREEERDSKGLELGNKWYT